eukprot:gb/GECG01014413.1/.p1 GENE.gb/GECG01014413.1/~~gb/GECG01014413.1/.p1  ORF type:complete len:196 (+),score=8.50 gb/GECG01014413.1/:1-588(+)
MSSYVDYLVVPAGSRAGADRLFRIEPNYLPHAANIEDRVARVLEALETLQVPLSAFRRCQILSYNKKPVYPLIYHTGRSTKETLRFLWTAVCVREDTCDFVLPQPSGTGKTHAMYLLGTDEDIQALVILCNVRDKPTYSTTIPWLFVENLVKFTSRVAAPIMFSLKSMRCHACKHDVSICNYNDNFMFIFSLYRV